MCGVLGIIGSIKIHTAAEMLQLLTHRGQDSAGLAWVNPNHSTAKINMVKAYGYPSAMEVPANETAFLTLGSTRYPTYGVEANDSVPLEHFSQPFSSELAKEPITIVHNGNIPNGPKIEAEYFGSSGKYLSDAHLIADLLGKLLKDANGDLNEALHSLSRILDGSYSLVGIYGKSLFAYRDPKGIRPLIMGKNGQLYVFSSESVVFQQLLLQTVRDVKPGELIQIKLNDELGDKEEESTTKFTIIEKQIIPTKESDHRHCMFEYVYFANPVSKIDNLLVYDARLRLGKQLARKIKQMDLKIDYVAPVPDTSRVAAQAIAEELHVPLREVIIKNRYLLHRTFILKNDQERVKAMGRKYLFMKDYIKGKNLLLVDDSIVRGNTSKKIISILRKLGARNIYFVSTCPPIRHPCYYGIDFASYEELLLPDTKAISEAERELGVDKLIYQDISDLEKSIGTPFLCKACLDGNYPTPFGEKLKIISLDEYHKAKERKTHESKDKKRNFERLFEKQVHKREDFLEIPR